MSAPRKRFGQNFLEDREVIERIVASIAPQPGERLVEIGPGRAALTGLLANRLGRMDVIEIDRDLARDLGRIFAPERVRIHQGDVLEFDFRGLGSGLRVVGNLPYNISTPILFALTAQADVIRDGHFMLQREVVQRMCAAAGTPDYGRLSVMLQYRWRIESVFDVPPTAFRPEPKVWSSLVRMVPHAELPALAVDEARFAQTVMLAFGQRRKTLRNALNTLVSASELEQLGVNPSLRGEMLDVHSFVRIANFLSARA
ncbi:MAG: 16S rRNA (adenine(1518)-N(6)/adenine(1519)-N(6))-dimethyltransferase RsmA [Burkholderiales bacterium]